MKMQVGQIYVVVGVYVGLVLRAFIFFRNRTQSHELREKRWRSEERGCARSLLGEWTNDWTREMQ